MHVDDVGADGDVHGRGQREPRRRSENARAATGQSRSLDRASDSYTQPEAGSDAVACRTIDELPGFARHAEKPAVETGSDVFGRVAAGRQLEVVDEAGAVHRHARQSPALEQ